MAISFYLKTTSAEKSPLMIQVNIRGTRYRHTAKISIETDRWNPRTQTLREVRGYRPAKPINDRLRKMREVSEELCDEIMTISAPLGADEFWNRFFRRLDGEVADTVVAYAEKYVAERARRSPDNTMKQYRTMLRILKEYEAKHRITLLFSDINIRFYQRLQQEMVAAGYSLNYFGSIIKCIKVMYRAAREVDGVHNLTMAEGRGFSAIQIASRSAYLNVEELQAIANVEITPEALIAQDAKLAKLSSLNMCRHIEGLNLARKKFLLGAFTALRVSDFNSLKDIHIQGEFFRVTTKKTGAAVVIPIHPVIRKLMDDGFDISTPIAEQKINEHIKKVARLAGITQMVEATKLVDHRAVVGWWPKCDIITTHTARRSAATNMFKAGIPAISIMKITGHTTEKSFMKYIKISAEENAELMAKSAFFAG